MRQRIRFIPLKDFPRHVMTVRTYLLGLTAAFGLPWLVMIGVPYGKMKDLQPKALDESGAEVYPPPNRGLIAYGQRVYNEQGCYQCHTQVVRPTYAGPDRWRKGWAGDSAQARETQPLDYYGLNYAALGVQRIGPDLANVGFRITDAAWHYKHLYNPRAVNAWSNMPSYKSLFKKRKIEGQPNSEALDVPGLESGYEVVPSYEAKALVTYLMAMRKDSLTQAPAP